MHVLRRVTGVRFAVDLTSRRLADHSFGAVFGARSGADHRALCEPSLRQGGACTPGRRGHLRHTRHPAEHKVSEERLRSAVEGAGRQALHQLEKNLNALGTIAAAAPLFGLLGTVIGMIEIFGTSGSGTSGANPQELAHGISVALYNTAFGLMVAIPSLIAYRHFRAKVDAFALQMEHGAERLVHHLLKLTAPRR
jgi:biopolymer transport protein ExbB/TolQ